MIRIITDTTVTTMGVGTTVMVAVMEGEVGIGTTIQMGAMRIVATTVVQIVLVVVEVAGVVGVSLPIL